MEEIQRRLALLRGNKTIVTASPPASVLPVEVKSSPRSQSPHISEGSPSPSPSPPDSPPLSPEEDAQLESKMSEYLALASTLPSIPSSLADRQVEAGLREYERIGSALPNTADSASTVGSDLAYESPISFFPSGSSSSSIPSTSRPIEEDELLIRRLQDELSLDSIIQTQEKESTTEWETRLSALHSFRPASSSFSNHQTTPTATGNFAKLLGEVPIFPERKIFGKRRKGKKGEKREGRGSDSESSTDSSDEGSSGDSGSEGAG